MSVYLQEPYAKRRANEIVFSENQIYLKFYFRSKEQEQTCCNSFLPPGRRAAGPPGRRAAGPSGRRTAGPWRAAGLLLAKPVSALWASPGVKGLIDRNTSLHLSKLSMHLITGIYHLSNSKNNYTPETDGENGNSLSSSKSFFFPR